MVDKSHEVESHFSFNRKKWTVENENKRKKTITKLDDNIIRLKEIKDLDSNDVNLINTNKQVEDMKKVLSRP